MTNYEQLFQQQMKDPQFVNAYYDARVERLMVEMLNTLKENMFHDEPKENLIQMIDSMQHQIHVQVNHIPQRKIQKQFISAGDWGRF